MLRWVQGSVANWGPSRAGYDAVAVSPAARLVALCDGANSCAGSGDAARWLGAEWVSTEVAPPPDERAWTLRLEDLHARMLARHPGTASTLVFAHMNEEGVTLGGSGDSYLLAYHRADWPWSRWRPGREVPRDLTADGHPAQMPGSEVCGPPHLLALPPRGTYLLVLMSDGAGDFWPAGALLRRLRGIGAQEPSASDLTYFCQVLAQHALERGSRDDVSVAIVWCRYAR
jgi:hypothetical protein